jgi:DNA polymerase I-like protein with 3'-5' exonuclease and polymerase domains
MERANHWGYIRLVNGRVRHFTQWKDHHEAFNQYVQGSLAELMNEWLLETEEQFPNTCLLTIHDSLVVETASRRRVDAIAKLGAHLGTQMFDVPMVVDVKEWSRGA